MATDTAINRLLGRVHQLDPGATERISLASAAEKADRGWPWPPRAHRDLQGRKTVGSIVLVP